MFIPYTTLPYTAKHIRLLGCICVSFLPFPPGRFNAASVTRSVARRHPVDPARGAALQANDRPPRSRGTHQDLVTMLILILMLMIIFMLIDLSHCITCTLWCHNQLCLLQYAALNCHAVQHTELYSSFMWRTVLSRFNRDVREGGSAGSVSLGSLSSDFLYHDMIIT
jgi:hypothetical protein